MVLSLPLEAIVPDHLVRDRTHLDEEALNALKQSLLARGQQMPIEVVPLSEEGRYGLLSGWRRLAALKALRKETGEARFEQILCLVRQPDDLAQSYVAMVEENEIRADLSFFERARIVDRAVEAGVFDSDKTALQSLFSAASYARRSKIKSFLPIVRELGDALRFPQHLSERAGLALSRRIIEEPQVADRVRQYLADHPPASSEEEAARIAEALRPERSATASPEQTDDITVTFAKGKIVLSGAQVDADLAEQLAAWLKTRTNRPI